MFTQEEIDEAVAQANANLEKWEDDEEWAAWLASGAGGFI